MKQIAATRQSEEKFGVIFPLFALLSCLNGGSAELAVRRARLGDGKILVRGSLGSQFANGEKATKSWIMVGGDGLEPPTLSV
jgi:hypothetical protein